MWAKLTQRDEAKQKSEQEQEEEEETQQPLPPGAARVGAAAESSSAKRAAVPVDLWGQCEAVSLTLKHWMHPGNESLRCEYHSTSDNKDQNKIPAKVALSFIKTPDDPSVERRSKNLCYCF